MSSNSPIRTTDTFFVGENKVLEFTVVRDEDEVPTVPRDITGYAITFELRDPDDTILVTKTVGAGIILTAPVTGVLQVTLDAADTVALPDPPANGTGQRKYNLRRTDVSDEQVLAFGTAAIQQL